MDTTAARRLFAEIRKSWWLDDYCEGLVLDRTGEPAGILALRSSLRCLRLPISPRLTVTMNVDTPSAEPFARFVTLERIAEGVWVADRLPCEDEGMAEGIIAITAPLPAPAFMLAVAAAFKRSAIAKAEALLWRLTQEIAYCEGPPN